ncbi:MAG: VWA domain-containing protein [Epsilonproteobacteria bacterium]|nr:VWA domain-containing protein [Campylobacterota bacterium]
MEFLHPEFLYLMLPPVFILFVLLLTQKESQAKFFAEEVIQKLRVSANTLTLKARNGLFFLMALLLVIALADPVISEGEVEVQAKSADIMIAIDISDSMLAQDLYPNRLKLAKQKALQFLREERTQRVGVVAFAKNAYMVAPLSFDHAALGFLLENLDTDSITEQGTDLLSMLEVVNGASKQDTQKYILLLSDGGDASDFSQEIAYAKKNNITVFILGVATKKGAPVRKSDGSFIKYKGEILISKLNEKVANLAIKTGGVYIEAQNGAQDIKAMIKAIKSHVKQKEIRSQKIHKYIPLFYYPLGLAMILLLVATSSMSKRRSVAVPVLLLLAMLHVAPAQAGVLDFMELDKAKKAYSNKDYKTAAKIYQKYAKQLDSSQSYYNAGNAFYNMKKYDNAIKMYERVVFSNPEYKANKLANLGKSHAKLDTVEHLEKAKKYMEESLKIKDDKELQQDFQEVVKRLKKKKQQQKQKNNKQNNKDQKNKQQQKGKGKQDKKDQNKQNKDKNGKNKQKKQQQHKKEQQKDVKREKKEEKQQQSSGASKQKKQAKMSDAEERKWLKKLDKNPSTFLYQLNRNKKVTGYENEKPW